jgi:hypothetical protein
MGKKQLQEAAAHARAARLVRGSSPFVSAEPSEDNPGARLGSLSPIVVALDSDEDCNYSGGVNCHVSDSEYDSSADWGSDEVESLAELEGDALEENLHELRAELESLGAARAAPSNYELISAKKSDKEWKKAEKNRSLGYTGTSTRTKQRKAKAAREQAIARNEAKSL